MTPTARPTDLAPGARPGRRHVVVVGGGVSGLAAAHALATSAASPRVTVLEQHATVGGKLAVAEVDGLPVDQGAESVLTRRPEALALIAAVGLGPDVVGLASTGASVWSRGA